MAELIDLEEQLDFHQEMLTKVEVNMESSVKAQNILKELQKLL